LTSTSCMKWSESIAGGCVEATTPGTSDFIATCKCHLPRYTPITSQTKGGWRTSKTTWLYSFAFLKKPEGDSFGTHCIIRTWGGLAWLFGTPRWPQ
jgi:hypothetical protein